MIWDREVSFVVLNNPSSTPGGSGKRSLPMAMSEGDSNEY